MRDSGAAVRALVDALGQLPRQRSLRDAADQLTRKWRPLVQGNGSGEDLLTTSVGRYYSEYMSDAAKRLRWASAELAEQGSGSSCQPAYQTLNAALLLFCDTFVAGAEGYWLAHVLAFVLQLCFGPICLGMANHFLVMENYVYQVVKQEIARDEAPWRGAVRLAGAALDGACASTVALSCGAAFHHNRFTRRATLDGRTQASFYLRVFVARLRPCAYKAG
ncbi:hypothetical protein MRX96_006697 [Rhipicephalus microplus]